MHRRRQPRGLGDYWSTTSGASRSDRRDRGRPLSRRSPSRRSRGCGLARRRRAWHRTMPLHDVGSSVHHVPSRWMITTVDASRIACALPTAPARGAARSPADRARRGKGARPSTRRGERPAGARSRGETASAALRAHAQYHRGHVSPAPRHSAGQARRVRCSASSACTSAAGSRGAARCTAPPLAPEPRRADDDHDDHRPHAPTASALAAQHRLARWPPDASSRAADRSTTPSSG